MTTPEVPPDAADSASSILGADGLSCGHTAALLEGLQRQRDELGPIADELIELLRLMGVG